jgi:DNA adenine methylase
MDRGSAVVAAEVLPEASPELHRPAPRRPALRYHGGKWRLASWVISHFRAHEYYVEPFGGAASVLLRKPRSYGEVYNDLDDEVVNLFRVLRDPATADRLRQACALTAFARTEFVDAYEVADDPVERARRLIVRSFMGHGSSGVRKHRTGFRGTLFRQHTTPASDWVTWPEQVPVLVERLRGVIIEQRTAAEIFARYDSADTLFYVDPPYPYATRSQKRKGTDLYHGYRHELTDEQHVELLAQCRALKGQVILSSYPNELYDRELRGWTRRETKALADGAEPRREAVSLNKAAARAA